MKLYLIGGLGADERVFDYLDLGVDRVVVDWISPESKEDISGYARRLADQIDVNGDFGLLGVSFGGIVAIEIAKLYPPNFLILVSSVATNDQLSSTYLSFGKLGVLNLVPNSLMKPPGFLQYFFFGAKNKALLSQIISDTKPTFIRWALNVMINWTNCYNSTNIYRIHGTNDRLIPLKGEAVEIKGGGHFMIVDQAEEISKLINEYINSR